MRNGRLGVVVDIPADAMLAKQRVIRNEEVAHARAGVVVMHVTAQDILHETITVLPCDARLRCDCLFLQVLMQIGVVALFVA